MYSFTCNFREEKMNYIFNYNERVLRLQEVYSRSPALQSAVNSKLKDKGKGNEYAIGMWISNTAKEWGYDQFSERDKDVTGALYSTISFSNAFKGDRMRTVTDKGISQEGEEFDAMLVHEAIHTRIALQDLDKHFKYLLKGLDYVSSSFNQSLDNIHFRTLYMCLLNNSNNISQYYMHNISKDVTYVKNQSSVTSLVDAYFAKNSKNGLDLAKDAITRYLKVSPPPRELSSMNEHSFFECIKQLFNEVLGLGIFQKSLYNDTKGIEDEIKEIGNLIPVKKFESDFIDTCPTLTEWMKLDENAFDSDYNIGTYDIPGIENLIIEPAEVKDKLLDTEPMVYLPTLYFKMSTEEYNKDIVEPVYRSLLETIERKHPRGEDIIQAVKEMEDILEDAVKGRKVESIGWNAKAAEQAQELVKEHGVVESFVRRSIDESLAANRAVTNAKIMSFIRKYGVNTEKLSRSIKDLENLKNPVVDNLIRNAFGFPELINVISGGPFPKKDYLITKDYILISDDIITYPELGVVNTGRVIVPKGNWSKIRSDNII